MEKIDITHQDIQALIDNELDETDAKRVCAYLHINASAHTYYNKIRQQKKLLQRLMLQISNNEKYFVS